MLSPRVYRGGSDLIPQPRDVKVDRTTGLLQPTHGVSLSTDPTELERFGGAFEVIKIPEGLAIKQRGMRPTRYELMPAKPMTWERYRELLGQVVLSPPAEST